MIVIDYSFSNFPLIQNGVDNIAVYAYLITNFEPLFGHKYIKKFQESKADIWQADTPFPKAVNKSHSYPELPLRAGPFYHFVRT